MVHLFFKAICCLVDSGVARLWSQGGHRTSEGRKSRAGSRGGALVGSAAKPAEARYIQNYRQFAAVNCFSMKVRCPVRPPSPLTPIKKTLDLRKSHEPTRLGQSGQLCYCLLNLLTVTKWLKSFEVMACSMTTGTIQNYGSCVALQ